jgi:hypothetical protein
MPRQLSPVADMAWHTPWAAMGHERPYALQQKTSAWPRFGAANIKPNL